MNFVELRTSHAIGSWQQFHWRHPEWWVKLLYVGAWALMLVHGGEHFTHGMDHAASPVSEFVSWMVMVVAMTLPFLMYSVRFSAFASLWSRRHRAIVAFLTGYLAPWAVFGLGFACLRVLPWSHTYLLSAACFVAATLWQLTGVHRRAMVACHASYPVALTGFAADRSCVTYGTTIACASVLSCWPMMLACGFANHSLVAIVGSTMVEYLNQTASPYRRSLAPLLLTVLLAVYFSALALSAALSMRS